MDDLAEIRLIFFEECNELLLELATDLKKLANGESTPDTINAIFRAVHSIKGGAGAFGLERLVHFAHRIESVLDSLRAGKFTADNTLCDLLFNASDRLADLIEHAKAGDADRDLGEAAIAAAIEACADAKMGSTTVDPMMADDPLAGLDFTPIPFSMEPQTPQGQWRVGLKPTTTLYTCGDDIRATLAILQTLGPCETRLILDDLPSLARLDPQTSYLRWELHLQCDGGEDAIRTALEWSIDDLGLTIAFDQDDVVAPVGQEPPAPYEPEPEPEPEPKPAQPKRPEPVQPPDTGAQSAPPAPKVQASIRVDLARVDKLVDLVGELVINQAALHQSVQQLPKSDAAQALAALIGLDRLTRELQEGVMAMRANPIGTVFRRMERVVREAASATEKAVTLTLEGEHIEVDRSIVEHLVDPLTHILRNGVDHGIELPSDREGSGKQAAGHIRLSARQRSDRLVVEISDDGRGIDPERVRAKARENGLIDANATLDLNQTYNLIFAPGFSTAASVSALSGRGVGMDVVKKTISKLGGRIAVQSEIGQGTTITLSLPLTLAILDGMIFRAGEQVFIAPVGHIIESLTPDPARIFTLSTGGLIYNGRDVHIPIIDVGLLLGQAPCIRDNRVALIMVVETERGQRMALAVDEILQQSQVVIKSIEKNYDRVDGIAAATILGNGDVALIIDIDALTEISTTLSNGMAVNTLQGLAA